MTDLNEMWTELERYQPYADRRGFGDEWLRMTTERTEEAARVAWDAAYSAACYATASAAAAAWESPPVTAQRYKLEASPKWAQHAIKYIREAIAQEQT